MDFQIYKKQLMKNSAFRKAYKESKLEYQIARALIKARLEQGMTQKELAKRLKTSAKSISSSGIQVLKYCYEKQNKIHK